MKKRILIGLVLLISSTFSYSQRVYSTKSAQIKFLSSTATEDIEATNNQVVSKLTDKTGQLIFSLLIKGFVFENAMMQEHFNGNEYMQSDKYPKAEFRGFIVGMNTVDLGKDGGYPVMVSGTLTIKGIEKPVKAAGLILVEKHKITAESSFKIRLQDYGITGKDIGTVIASNIEIKVTAKYE
jgi:hypothetical protein